MSSNQRIITHVPIIDLSKLQTEPKEVAHEVLSAARDIGFLYVKIPPEQEEHSLMFEMSKGFFKLPTEEKLKHPIGTENLGYSAIRQEKVDPENDIQGDLKESFHIGRLINDEPIQELPKYFQDELDTIRKFQKLCNSIACDIMDCFSIALEIPEKDGGRSFFSEKYLSDTVPQDCIRLLHYPASESSDCIEKNDIIRIGRHSDYGLITLLWQRDVGGLQIQSNETEKVEEMTWLDVPVRDDCLIVNMGDCLQYWTNGFIRSTKHRVIFKADSLSKERYSIAYFIQGGHIPLNPVPSEKIPPSVSEKIPFKTSADYLAHRLSVTYNGYY
ncbi:unnamed protein product [Cunninghamella blakesleeana]